MRVAPIVVLALSCAVGCDERERDRWNFDRSEEESATAPKPGAEGDEFERAGQELEEAGRALGEAAREAGEEVVQEGREAAQNVERELEDVDRDETAEEAAERR
jgi:hypothetical protein